MSDAGRPLRVLLTLALLVALASAAGSAHADSDGYTHQWQAETLFAGETGSTATEVLESSAWIAEDDGGYRGAVVYADLLGIADLRGEVVSLETRIELDLTGRLLEGGATAGGTFTGRATVTERRVASVEEAVSTAVRSAAGVETQFELRGHWGAQVENGALIGEILYERVRHLSGDGVVHEPAWFNRASLANPDGLGDPQRLEVAVGAQPPADVDPGDGAAGEGETGSDSRPADTEADGSSEERRSVFGYIARGVRGAAAPEAPPVPAAEERAARRLFESRPAGARTLPAGAIAIDVHVGGAYLDAKNRAAGLLSAEDGPALSEGASLVARAAEVRATAAPAITRGDLSPAELHVGRIRSALMDTAAIGNAEEFLARVGLVAAEPDREQVALLRTWAAVAEAVAASGSAAGVLEEVYGVTVAVAETPVPVEGPLAEAVLVAADSSLAPPEAHRVAGFEQVPEYDFRPERGVTDPSLPARVLALHGSGSHPPALTWDPPEGRKSIGPELWTAHRRADGTIFWLGDVDGGVDGGDSLDSEVALTDASVRGWAFTRSRAALVDASRCGRVLAHYRTE